MTKEYKLNTVTIKDIINNIPEDKWDEVFEEMQTTVKQVRGVMKLLKVTAEAMNMPVTDVAQFPDEITWIDDGKRENTIKFTNEETGDSAGEMKLPL